MMNLEGLEVYYAFGPFFGDVRSSVLWMVEIRYNAKISIQRFESLSITAFGVIRLNDTATDPN